MIARNNLITFREKPITRSPPIY